MPEFTSEDFLDGVSPYEWLYQFNDNPFVLNQMLDKLVRYAKSLRITGVKAKFQNYQKTLKLANSGIIDGNYTRFEGQDLELDCGQWQADDGGISIYTPVGERFACPHPILPVMRLCNIDTGEEKVKLEFRKGKKWRSLITDKNTIANARNIVSLANNGIAVTSESSRLLVQYLADVENMNLGRIPEMPSVGRLGWVEGGFAPYVDGLIFDGEDGFERFFHAVETKGNEKVWMDYMKDVRARGALPVRVILAASFASVLIKPLHLLSFFVHLWGSESGIGKTVGLILAASVWANPEKGMYWNTFNGTNVSQELSAGFLNSLPLVLDEFQLVNDKKSFEKTVYMLAEGIGRGRGKSGGGLQKTQTWANCILTSGESPITNFVTGAGAYNRIVEIECTAPFFDDVQVPLRIVRENYGYAGRAFVECLQEEGALEEVEQKYQEILSRVNQSDAAEKQAMAGAALLTADYFMDVWLFKDGGSFTLDDLSPYLQTKTEIDIGERAYDYICETVAANAAKFNPSLENIEHWGRLDAVSNRVFIIRKAFDQICEDGGFSSRAVLSWLARKKLVECSRKGSGKAEPTKTVRFNWGVARCVVLTLKKMDEEEYLDEII